MAPSLLLVSPSDHLAYISSLHLYLASAVAAACVPTDRPRPATRAGDGPAAGKVHRNNTRKGPGIPVFRAVSLRAPGLGIRPGFVFGFRAVATSYKAAWPSSLSTESGGNAGGVRGWCIHQAAACIFPVPALSRSSLPSQLPWSPWSTHLAQPARVFRGCSVRDRRPSQASAYSLSAPPCP